MHILYNLPASDSLKPFYASYLIKAYNIELVVFSTYVAMYICMYVRKNHVHNNKPSSSICEFLIVGLN